jgi:hypothetical protein
MKQVLLCFTLLLITASLWAQTGPVDSLPAAGEPAESPAVASEPVDSQQPASEPADSQLAEGDNADPAAEETSAQKKPFRFKNRTFELGFNMQAGFANDFTTTSEILKKTVVVDVSNFEKGLKIDAGAYITPLSLNLNWKDKWGGGLFAGLEAAANMDISGNMVTFKKTDEDNFGAGGAVFLDIGTHAFFYIDDFKIKIKTSGFIPLAYVEPGITYRFITRPDGYIKAGIDYDMRVYTAFDAQVMVDKGIGEALSTIDASLGIDLGIGVEYPLSRWLDLDMDFDVGVEMTHFPLVPAVLKQYMYMAGYAGIETNDIINDVQNNIDSLFQTPDDFDPKYGKDEKQILRPFKMVAYGNYRPFDTSILTLTPLLGFAINPLYVQPGSIEVGARARCDLSNLFITTVGIGYLDRKWKNSIDFVFNFRAMELDIGIAAQSQSFVKSWQAAGVEIAMGLKFGW